jgi:hypothetical protein
MDTKVYHFFRNSNYQSSEAICVGIGSLIQSHPMLVTHFNFGRLSVLKEINRIYEAAEKKRETGYQSTLTEPGPRGNLMSSLDKGDLLLVNTASRAMIFGNTAGQYWRFDPLTTNQSASLTIFGNKKDFQEALRKVNSPFNLINVTASEPIEKQRILAKM